MLCAKVTDQGRAQSQRDLDDTAIAVEQEEVAARQDHFLDDIATAAAQKRLEAWLAAFPEPDVPVGRMRRGAGRGAPADIVDLASSDDENHDDAGEDAPGSSGGDGRDAAAGGSECIPRCRTST